jgi:hypothetical protein
MDISKLNNNRLLRYYTSLRNHIRCINHTIRWKSKFAETLLKLKKNLTLVTAEMYKRNMFTPGGFVKKN